VLDAAVVTCCTLTGVHSFQLRGRQWDLVVVDEAAQALEVATWGALLRGRRAVLAGTPPASHPLNSSCCVPLWLLLQRDVVRLEWSDSRNRL
jgi:AAA domain